FLTFGLEEGWDALYIYNSTSVGVNQVPGPQGVTLSGFPGGNWQSISPGVVRANFGLAAVGSNPEEALTVQFRSDATNTAAGWAAVVVEVPKTACQLTPPPDLTVNTGPASTSCLVAVNTPLPTYSPAGCNSGSQLRYRLNGGSPVVVTDVGFTQIPAPKGQNVVLWELLDLCGGGVYSSGVQSITVVDNTPPALTCPSNLTFHLQGGQCAAFVNYNVSLSDNCSFMQAQTVSHPIDFDNGQAGIMFNVSNLGLVPISITEFGPSLDVGTWPMEVYVTSTASSWVGQQNNAAAWSLLANPTVNSVSPGTGTPVGGFSLTLAPGESRGIYLTSKSGFPLNFTGTGAGISRQYDDGTLRVSSAPGAGVAYPFGTATQSRAYNGYVKYAANATGLPVQVGGLPSGSAFPLGTTVNTFMGTDAAGNSTVCSFSVTVKEYPNPLWSLTCNDLSYVALGDGCTTTLNADQVLEGGPYKCYDYYVVEIDRTLPLGNGPWQPAILTSADIGKTYTVRVLDPVTGNKCQGDIKVQDNLAPQLQCSVLPTFVPCSFPPDPGFSKQVTVNQRFAASGLPLSVVDNQTRTLEIPVSGPADLKVNDLDLRVRISGDAFAFNLRIWVESPSGTMVTVWDEYGGCGNLPLWVRFDDEGLGGIPQCPDLSTDKKIAPPFLIGQLSAFDQQNPNGIWKVHIRDVDAGGNLSSIETVELHLNMSGTYSAGFPGLPVQAPVVALGNNSFRVPAGLLDACSDVTLSFTQTEVKEDCKTGFASTIQRRWLARDASGNTSVCVQQIKVLSPSFQDVMLPPDFHRNSGGAFACQGQYPTPDWIESQGLQGWPHLYGLPEACSVSWTYEDQVTSECEGSYTIVRRWRFLDLCDAVKVHFHNQVIQVLDDEGPSVACPANLTATTDPFSCCATVDLPDALLDDVCSRVQGIGAAV
ncbi:MAG TPA: HYR domain-containing protein, partial [Saprospiraceae bacterium]|nr:HYR domain-containing protein [Saprospiraceae bacterium]